MQHPDYRVSVEVIIIRDNKVLLAKRVKAAKVAPNVWSVPAGKVKFLEIPTAACVREAKEETGLDVEIVKEVRVRAFKTETDEEVPQFRLVFTYLTKIIGAPVPTLSEEHSEFYWAAESELDHKRFKSMREELKDLIKEAFHHK